MKFSPTITTLTAAMMLTVMAACRKEHHVADALYSCDSFTVCPDSIDSDRLIVAPRDSMMLTIKNGTATLRPMARPVAGRLSMSGGDTLFVDLFNLSVERLADREADISEDPVDIFMTLALTDPDLAAAIVEKNSSEEVSDKSIGFMSWPVLAGDASWGLAAREVSLATGDISFSTKMADRAERLIQRDRRLSFDEGLHLFKGATDIDICPGMMPRWMTAADFAEMFSLRANIDHLLLMRMIDGAKDSGSCDSLVNAIDTYFWMPNLDCYSRALYGCPYPIQLEATDNIAQALAVVTGSASRPMAAALVASAPLYHDMIPTGYPSASPADFAPDMTATALWAIAAAKTGNEKALVYALAQLAYHASDSNSGASAVVGAFLRSLAGISLTESGMSFAPMIPSAMPGEKKFTHLPYRDAILDITINGSGNIISTFMIDGEVTDSHFVPADISGHHDISITLVGLSDDRNNVNLVDHTLITPAPETDWTSSRHVDIGKGRAAATMLYLDGAFIDETDGSAYTLYESAPTTAVAFVSVSENNHPGFASPTRLYIPSADSVSIDVASVARTGARTLNNKRKGRRDDEMSRKFVESTRFKNSSIPFEIVADNDCERYVQVVYLNGLGIVNPERHYATRMLNVNNRPTGIFVLPQLKPDAWRHDMDWRSLQGTSLPMKIALQKGSNSLSLDYYAPQYDDFDHDANALIPVKVIISKP